VNIRSARRGDARHLATVHCIAALAAYVDIFPPDGTKPTPDSLEPGWRALIDDPDVDVFVATAGQDLVGSIVLQPDDDVPAKLLLKRLYVEPSQWHLGIGSALHDHALAQARSEQPQPMGLGTQRASTEHVRTPRLAASAGPNTPQQSALRHRRPVRAAPHLTVRRCVTAPWPGRHHSQLCELQSFGGTVRRDRAGLYSSPSRTPRAVHWG